MSLQSFKELQDKLLKIKNDKRVLVKQAFDEGVKSIFDNYPIVNKIKFQIYMPGFNDGDPITLCSNHDEPYVQWKDCETNEDGDENWSEGSYGRIKDEEKESAYKFIKEILRSFDEEDILNLFDQDKEIIISRNGISEEYYDCGY